MSDTSLLGLRFLCVLGTPGEKDQGATALMQGVCHVCLEHLLLVQWQTCGVCVWILRNPARCVESYFLFLCPFRIILASTIGL